MSEVNSRSTRDVIGLAYRSYNRAKPILGQRPDREIRHPEWTRRLLDHFDAPDTSAINIMVTGSKGKGSHAILLAGMLQKLGLRVGLFTSPHLVDFMERFRVAGSTLAESVFTRYMLDVADVAESLPVPETQYIGPVGMLAVVAALWFRDAATDVNVFECGRGALYDDVNQLAHAGAVVAPVFLEHARELGPTLADVAREKAGVVSAQTRWVVTHRQTPQPRQQLAAACRKVGAPLFELDRDFHAGGVRRNGIEEVTVQSGDDVTVMRLPAIAGYVAGNAAVAWMAARKTVDQIRSDVGRGLRRCGPSDELVTLGRSHEGGSFDLTDIRLPGRMQIVRDRPLTLVDGTIHAESAAYVQAWVAERRKAGQHSRVAAIVGIPSDKDGEGVIQALAAVVDVLITARAHNPHLVFDDGLRVAAEMQIGEVLAADFIEDAAPMADARLPDDGLLLVLGTQSFVGDALAYFQAPTQSIWPSKTREGVPG